MPLETKQANSVLMKVTKMRNKKTGEVAMRVDEVNPLDYEFECEALADYAYQVNKDKSNKESIKDYLAETICPTSDKVTPSSRNIELIMPTFFTSGKTMYS